MSFHRFRQRLNTTFVAWIVLLTMPCAGMVPQSGHCRCPNCSCSENSPKQGADTPTETPHPCCASKKIAAPLPAADQCGCSSGAPCRCSENGTPRISAIRSSANTQQDCGKKVKHTFDNIARHAFKEFSAPIAPAPNRGDSQFALHIQLPRLHLLLSVLLN